MQGVASKQRLRVFYCDDQQRFREQFVDRHQDRFEVETVSDISQVLPALRGREDDLPDLLLLDLYHDVEPAKDDERRRRAEEANAALDELDEAIRRTKDQVDRAWQPVAIEIAEEIRRHFPPHVLPIMIYTQKGLFFLDDEQIRRIEQAEVEWLLKDSDRFSAATEDLRIRRVVERSRASLEMPRDVKIAAWSVGAGFAGSLLTLLVQALLA
jgi:hypothetical protein